MRKLGKSITPHGSKSASLDNRLPIPPHRAILSSAVPFDAARISIELPSLTNSNEMLSRGILNVSYIRAILRIYKLRFGSFSRWTSYCTQLRVLELPRTINDFYKQRLFAPNELRVWKIKLSRETRELFTRIYIYMYEVGNFSSRI